MIVAFVGGVVVLVVGVWRHGQISARGSGSVKRKLSEAVSGLSQELEDHGSKHTLAFHRLTQERGSEQWVGG